MKLISGFFCLIFLSIISFSQIPPIVDLQFDFEQSDTLITIDTSQAENPWKIGIPTNFDSAYSWPNAIYTDFGDNDSIIRKSSFYITIISENFATGYMEFLHRYNTDLGKSGGYVDISYDQGKTWYDLIHPLHYWMERFYGPTDSICNKEVGFSGSIDNWSKAVVWFSWYIGVKKSWDFPDNWGWYNYENSDTLLIRFNYLSCPNESDPSGWIIDDILIQIYPYTGISRLYSQSKPVYFYQSDSRMLRLITPNRIHQEYNVTIYDLSGKVIRTEKYSPSTIDVANLEKGVYLISVQPKSGLYRSQKVFIY